MLEKIGKFENNNISKFEQNNPDITVNVLFTNKKSFYTARRSDFNGKRKNQVNLIMIFDSKNRHYTTIRNLSRLLFSMNANHKGAYHFFRNCLIGFRTESARDKHYDYCRDKDNVKIKMPSKREKWLQYHDGQYQFKVLFMLYADFESILKPVERAIRG